MKIEKHNPNLINEPLKKLEELKIEKIELNFKIKKLKVTFYILTIFLIVFSAQFICASKLIAESFQI